MLTSIEVSTSGLRNSLNLPIEHSEDPLERVDYFVKDVVGLDPVQASISSMEYARQDGALFQQAKVGLRNIVITLGMNPDYADKTVQTLREHLYGYFMPKSTVSLRFNDDVYVTRQISGMVESMDFPIFTSEPEVSISILCFEPNFSSVEETVKSFQTTALSEKIEIDYQGTAPTGVTMEFFPQYVTDGFKFEIQSEAVGLQTLSINVSFGTDRGVILNTQTGKRNIVIADSKSGVVPAFRFLNPTTVWPQLYPGSNLVRLYTLSTPQDYTLTYRESFGGL